MKTERNLRHLSILALFACGVSMFGNPNAAFSACACSPNGNPNCLSAAPIDSNPLGARIPLVLIHGWAPDDVPGLPQEDAWDAFLEYYWITPLLTSKYKPYTFEYYSNDVSIFDLGGYLRDVLDQENQIDTTFGSKPIVIMAHSMGGLVARSFMAQHWQLHGSFSNLPGGTRVLKLITLGTPHHGSPLANGYARDDRVRSGSGEPGYGNILALFDNSFYSIRGPLVNEPNRNDLHWDNYDYLLDYVIYYTERNDWMAQLNSATFWDSKIVAYAGRLPASNVLTLCLFDPVPTDYCRGNAILGGALSLASDGVVPISSALLYADGSMNSRVLWRLQPDYDHTQIRDGKGNIDLFELLKADLLVDWPLAVATLSATPTSGAAPLPVSLTASVTGGSFGTVNYNFWWHCPFPVTTVQGATQLCGDPTNPTIGFKVDNSPSSSLTTTAYYQNPGSYVPLVIVERYTGAFPKTANITVAAPSACTGFTISPSTTSPDHQAGSRSVAIIGSPSGCQGGNWTATGNGSWLTVTPASGTGSGSVTASWTANGSSTSRSGTATIAGSTFSVNQSGTTAGTPTAPFLLAPGAAVFPGTTVSAPSPRFFWLSVPNADSYQLELSDATTVYTTETILAPQTSVILQTPLQYQHAYKWRMRSHSAAGWGGYGVYYYFSTLGQQGEDFALSATPTSSVVAAGSSRAFNVVTTTTAGSPQSLSLTIGNLPAGVSASFSSSAIQSGEQATLTLNAGSAAIPGAYSVTITATSNLGLIKTYTIGLTVNPPPIVGEPSVCLTPESLGFSDQMVGTSSATQAVTLRNCGNGPLHVSSIGASPEFFIGIGSIVPPVDLPAGTATSFQVGFSPLGSGIRTGGVKVFSNAAGSPATLTMSGVGIPAPLTTGTVQVNAILNGQPYSGGMVFSVTGPGGTILFGNVPLTWVNQGAGTYTVGFEGQPPGGGTLTGISPSNTQPLTAGDSILFTFDFTALNDFSFTCPTATTTGTTAAMETPIGGSASVPLTAGYIHGGTQTITLSVTGLPAGASGSFSPNPIVLAGPTNPTTFTVTTDTETPAGLYQLTFTATNQDGTSRSLTGTLVVLSSPGVQLVSRGVGSAPADGYSDYPTLSTDGRYVAFFSFATNLVVGDTNGAADVFVRDLQTGTTTRASLADDGSQANDFSGLPSISADGRFVAFRSTAGNLVAGGRLGFGDIYVRDRSLGRTVLASVSSTGVPADRSSLYSAISGDGRFVAFSSNSTNLVPGGGGGHSQIYVRDLVAQRTVLASAANDGSPADSDAIVPAISGDGRYVAFLSNATNLVPGATANGRQIFIRDLREGTVSLVSGTPGGIPPSGPAPLIGSFERLPISPDGRFVAFTSTASNLVLGDANAAGDVFLWDRVTQQIRIASLMSDGTQVRSAQAPAVSADGRFVAFGFGIASGSAAPIAVRDMTTSQSVIPTIATTGGLGSGANLSSTLSADGRVLAFASTVATLVTGDTNGLQDVFTVVLPLSTPVYAKAVWVIPTPIIGGETATGTVTLSGPAPPGGASVVLYSSVPEVQVPPLMIVPEGSSSVSWLVPTLPVTSELGAIVTASYGGGSPWAQLTLERADVERIEILGGDGQVTGLGAPFPLVLRAQVFDALGNPAPDVIVQFTAPTSGASGIFSTGAPSALVTTDASGIAAAPALIANSTAGQYGVVASVVGSTVPPTVFSLRNGDGVIFFDGFESGSTSAWSHTVP